MADHHRELLDKAVMELEHGRREVDYWKWWAVRVAEKIIGGDRCKQ